METTSTLKGYGRLFYILASAFIVISTVGYQDAMAQADAKTQKLEAKVDATKLKADIADAKVFTADSLIKAGEDMVAEGSDDIKAIGHGWQNRYASKMEARC